MKRIIYYITDHGKGHATRSIAIIRELKKLDIDIIVRNSNAYEFIKNSLPQVQVIGGITDVGPIIKKDGISIDENESINSITKWIDDIDKLSNTECAVIKKFNPNLIISDISVMPLLTSHKTKTPAITISNFSWYDVLNFLSKKTLEEIRCLYDYSDLHIQLPLSTQLTHFKNKKSVGFVSRKPVMNTLDIRRELGIKKNDFCVLLALGNSEKEIKLDCDENIKFLTINTKTTKNNHAIDVSDWTEGQDLVSLSNLVICKCGYGFISECLTNGTPFFYVASDNHLEQMAISNGLKNYGLNTRISFNDISNMSFTNKFINDLQPISSQKNDTANVINLIHEYIKN